MKYNVELTKEQYELVMNAIDLYSNCSPTFNKFEDHIDSELKVQELINVLEKAKIILDCRNCNHCKEDFCEVYGDDPEWAVGKCAENGFYDYKEKENANM